MIKDDSRLNGDGAELRINIQDLVEVPAGIQDHSFIYGLSGLRAASAARENGESLFAGQGDYSFNVAGVLRQGHANGLDLIDGSVRGVAAAGEGVKQYLTAHYTGQAGGQRGIANFILAGFLLPHFTCKQNCCCFVPERKLLRRIKKISLT